ncbi:carbohydrate ABC transporter [Streptomyces sp. MS2.AVA.5]|uniref:Carbohydrate ABC transporter n=1 Tax=Streptomyces achmelvichensis TaxID=3134111 RepID=A0ACC6PKT9_9ACTN
MSRPLLRGEIRAQRSREYLMKQQAEFIQKHGEDLGAFYFLLMLLQTHGKKAQRRGDVQALRLLAHDLHAVYLKHTQ